MSARRFTNLVATSFLLTLGLQPVHGQSLMPQRPVDANDSTRGLDSDHSYLLPAAEILGFDFLLNRYNHRFSGSSDYDVSWSSIHRNLRGPWIVDDDPFKVNQFGHPYQGSIYHTAARSAGLGYWTASAYTFVGSVAWEIAGEQTPPAKNDQIASGIAGSFLGEPLFRMARLVLEQKSDIPYAYREWAAAAISPSYGFNRLAFGDRFESRFDDHAPIYYSRLRLGGTRTLQHGATSSGDDQRGGGEIDYAMDYGLPGKDGYTYNRPFDFFSFRVVASNPIGLEMLSSRGLLVGMDYSSSGDTYRGVWGIYANYDYLSPAIFHLSTTGLSVGSTGQWSPQKDLAFQGTVMAGLGYSAVSTLNATQDDRNYHYGVAPRLGVTLRAIAGARASLDIDAQQYYVGRIGHRSEGKDDVFRLDSSLTFRVAGRHAIGVRYVRSSRSATFPNRIDVSQTHSTIGIFYTLLGLDTFGTVSWK